MKKNHPMLKAFAIKMSIATAVFLFMLFLMWLFPLNVTKSMPYGIYMRLPKGELKPGDLVELDNPLEPGSYGVWVQKGILKRIDHITEDGKYWVRGESRASYDSRYFGAVDKDIIRYRLIPVLTSYDLPDCMLAKLPEGESDEK